MIARTSERAALPSSDRRVYVIERLSRYRPILLVVPSVVTLALAVAVLAGGLRSEWLGLGAIVVGPLVVLALLTFDLIRHG